MSVRICTVNAYAELTPAELDAISAAAAKHGRVVLLVPTFAERDVCRRSLADAGCGLGVNVTTPAAWIGELWSLFGDGCTLVTKLQRQLLIDLVLARKDADELLPLRDNPGTRHLLARIARDLLPAILQVSAGEDTGARGRLFALLEEYAHELYDRGLVETSQAAHLLGEVFAEEVPAAAACVMLRGVDTIPAYLLDLLAVVAREGECSVLLGAERTPFAPALADAFAQKGVSVAITALGAQAEAARRVPSCFIEVAGPHARMRAYADELASLSAAAGPGQKIAVVSSKPDKLFYELLPYLSARGVSSSARLSLQFGQTAVGRSFNALVDLVGRMRASREGELSRAEWWPAPELSDWLCSPISGVGRVEAQRFDRKIRSKRAMDVDAVLSELQSVQTRVATQRKRLPQDNPWSQVPVVCSDVVAHIWRGKPVSAFKSMLSVIETLPASAWPQGEGHMSAASEAGMAEVAIELLMNIARGMDVPQSIAVDVLDDFCVRQAAVSIPADDASDEQAPGPELHFLKVAQAAAAAPGTYAAVLCADVDVDSYPLSREEGIEVELAEGLGAPAVAIEPAARQRQLFQSTFEATSGDIVFARVTHDRQAKDRYPAAIWTELLAQAGGSACVHQIGEGDIAADFDAAAGDGTRTETVECLPTQELSDDAAAYTVLRQRTGDGDELAPRLFSASQIESYTSCPLCWFMSSRVRPSSIDAGFGNIEKGNFVHDVLYRLHERLQQNGMVRVRPENLQAALAELRDVFAEVRAEHARGKTASSAPLVPLNRDEEIQVDMILPQLESVITYEAGALAAYAPTYLEYSFNELGVSYAGVPLGGRIDRVDVDAEDHAVVIDYKHRGDVNAFKLSDPTVPLKDGTVLADDPRWLPAHTQSLIYAQAIRRAMGLDSRGALYFATKGRRQSMNGAVSVELVEETPGDGRVPGLKTGFPDEANGGTMTFDELLDRTEAAIGQRLQELSNGIVAASDDPAARHEFNHPLGFERRGA